MEKQVIELLHKKIECGITVATATVVKTDGSSPGALGAMLLMDCEGDKLGTVGGGSLEYKVEKDLVRAMAENTSQIVTYNLDHDEELKMICGGSVDVFIKVYRYSPQLHLAGGGHVGGQLYQLGTFLGFETIVYDDREAYANQSRYPKAKTQCGEMGRLIENASVSKDAYLIIASRGHKNDQVVLEAALNKKFKYIGMIGSRRKIKETFNNLLAKGFDKDQLRRVYTPVGIGIDDGTPEEIAFSIMCEVLMVKNKGQLDHLKNIKVIDI